MLRLFGFVLATAAAVSGTGLSCSVTIDTASGGCNNKVFSVNVASGVEPGATQFLWTSTHNRVTFDDATASSTHLRYNRADGRCDDSEIAGVLKLTLNDQTLDCPFTVSAVDGVKPVLSSVDAVMPSPYEEVEIDEVPDAPTMTANDGCDGDVSVTYTQGQSGTMHSVEGDQGMYSLTRTWSVSDLCGNLESFVQLLDVVDTTPPTFVNPPSDQSVECTMDIPDCEVVVTDNNDSIDPTVAMLSSTESTCEHTYQVIREWTATDGGGNTAQHTQTVSVSDDNAPSMTGLPDAEVTVACDLVPEPAQVGVTDNCDNSPSLVFNQQIIGDGNEYLIVRQWTASDSCGNTEEFTQSVTVEDTTAPVIAIEGDETVECRAHDPMPCVSSATDNCDANPSLSMAETKVPGSCDDVYQLVHSYTVSDESGNHATQSRTIFVEDSSIPVLHGVPADVSSACSPPARATVTAVDCEASISVTDNADVKISGDDYNYVMVRSWTAADNCGNSATEEQTITVYDETAPEFSNVPSSTTVTCDAVPAVADPSAEDNCCESTIDFTETVTPGSCQHAETIVRTWTATDCAGVSTTHEQVITVEPKTPVLRNKPSGTLNLRYELDAIPEPAGVTVEDYCGDAQVDFTQEEIPGTCDNSKTILRTWSVDDGCGVVPSYTQTIVVTDTNPPSITDPADRSGQCGPDEADWGVTAEDEDGSSLQVDVTCTQPAEGSCEDAGSRTCTFTATDACGNVATSDAVDTWMDTVAPDVTCALNATTVLEECDETSQIQYEANDDHYAGDGCCLMYVTTETWTASDRCGNEGRVCTEITNHNDNTPPAITVNPPSHDYSCMSDSYPTKEETLAAATVEDSFSSSNATISERTVTDDACLKVIVRTIAAVDCCLNADTADQTITISETTGPTEAWFSDSYGGTDLPEDQTIECPETPDEPNLTARTSCGASHEVSPSTETADNGRTVVQSWTWTDGCHYIEHQRTVFIVDTEPPTNLSGGDDASGYCVEPTATSVIADDACTSATCTVTDTTGSLDSSCSQEIRLWTCVDEDGLSATHAQTVTIYDDVDPEYTNPPASTTVDCNSEEADPIPGSDGCDGSLTAAVYSSVFTPSGTLNANTGVWSHTWILQDACGNSVPHTQFVTVQDITAPVLSHSDSTSTHECAAPTAPTVTATDNCDGDVAVDVTSDAQMNCAHAGTVTYTFTASDAEGNPSSSTIVYTVEDNSAPGVDTSGVSDATIAFGDSVEDTDPTNDIVTSDNCGTVTVNCSYVLTGEIRDHDDKCEVEYTWSCVATDECDNETPMNNVKKVTEIENFAPALSPKPEDVTIDCSDELPAQPEVSSPYGNVSYTQQTFGEDACRYYVRTWSVEYCGQSDAHSQTITVEDSEVPEITAPTYADDECIEHPVGNYSATDDCGGDGNNLVTVAFQETQEDVTPDGVSYTETKITRVFTAEDDCGNQMVLTREFIHGDKTPPQFHQSVNQTVDLEAPQGHEAPAVTAQDNCVEPTVQLSEETVPGTCPYSYTVVRTWTATDGSGNEVTMTQTVTVMDTQPPELYVDPEDGGKNGPMPANAENVPYETWQDEYEGNPPVVKADDAADGETPVDYTETIIDNAGVNNFTAIRTWTTEDDCGNSATHVQTITVVSPVACQPPHQTVECDQVDTVLSRDYYAANCSAHLSDDVDIVHEETRVDGTCDDSYTLIRTYTISDQYSDESVEIFQTITVQDTTNPTFDDPSTSGTTVLTKDQCAPEDPPTKTASDNCVVGAVGVTQGATTCTEGVLPIVCTTTYTATDDCGNSATTTHVQTGTDDSTRVSSWTNLAYLDMEDKTHQCATEVPKAEPECETVCGYTCEVDYTMTVVSASCPYVEVRVWNAEVHGHALETLTQTITIDDTQDPVVTVEADLDCYCNEVCDPGANATDNCDGAVAVVTTNAGGPVVTHCATDTCGNQACETQNKVVNPNEPPTILPAGPYNGYCSDPGYTAPYVDDDCDPVPSLIRDVTEYTVPGTGCAYDDALYRIIRTFTVTDLDGLSDSTVQTVTILDQQVPVIHHTPAYQESVHQQCVDPTWTVTSSDDCDDDAPVTAQRADIDQYSYTLTWSVTDECGKSASKVTTVRVQDTTQPEFVGDLPQDVTLTCGEDIPDAAVVSATDNCGSVTVTMTEDTQGDACTGITVTRTWTATDTEGNDRTHTQTITKAEKLAPVCTGTPNQHLDCAESYAAHQVVCTDPCDGDAVLSLNVDPSMTDNCNGDEGSITYSTTPDACGLSNSVTETRSRIDNTDPTFENIPADDTQACTYVQPISPTASDDCGLATVTHGTPSQQANGCTTVYSLEYTATDECGLTSKHTHTQHVEDREAPQLFGVPTDMTVDCAAEPVPGTVTATDDCATVVVEGPSKEGVTPSDPTHMKIEVLTWTVQDDCGQSDTRSQTITFQDTTPPELVGNFNDEVLDCVDPPEAHATATDDCSDPSVQITCVDSEQCGNTYTRVCTFVATDDAGYQDTATKTIDVVDVTSPDLGFSGTSVDDATIECTETWVPPTCTASDVCDGSVSCDMTSENIGTEELPITVYTFSAFDECGNGVRQLQTVTTEDTTNPTISAVQDRSYDCSMQLNEGHDPTYADTCAEPTMTKTFTDTSDCEGHTQRDFTWIVTDVGGNTVSTTATYTWSDTTPPTITMDSSDSTFECNGVGATPTATYSDDCTAVVTNTQRTEEHTDGTCTDSYTKTWTFTAQDDCGNPASSTVSFFVEDTTKPTFLTFPADATVQVTDTFPALVEPNVSDNCDIDTTVDFEETSTSGCTAVHTRTWTITDNCGNSDSRSQQITVEDNTTPDLTVPADITLECGVTDWFAALPDATATDFEGNFATVTHQSTQQTTDCSCTKEYIVTYTATNACNNQATGTTTVYIRDTTPPAFLCTPADESYQCSRDYTAQNIMGTDQSFDAAQQALVSDTFSGTDCDKTIVRTYTLSDCAGNVATHQQTITIQDQSEPEFAREPADITVECGCDTFPAMPSLKAVDNCDDIISVVSEETGNTGTPGVVTRTFTATDVCGNQNEIVQEITVEDTTGPVLSGCPEDEQLSCEQVSEAEPQVGVSDECDASLTGMVTPEEQVIPGSCYGEYKIVRTWSATDASGNQASQSQTVSVVDETAPELMAYGIPTCLSPNGKFYTVSTMDMFNAYDNCGKVDSAEGQPLLTMKSCNGTVEAYLESGMAFPPSSCALSDDGSELTIHADPDRSFTVYAEISDECGNSKVVSHTFNIPATQAEASAAGCAQPVGEAIGGK